ncbi:unnamed protein product [Pylaiella littoralis]
MTTIRYFRKAGRSMMAVCPAAAQEDMNGLRDGESGYGADDRLEARAAIPVPVAAADPAKKCQAQPEPPHRRAYGTSHPSFSFREASLPPSFDNPTSAATCHQEHSSLLSSRNNSRTPAVEEGRGGGAPGGGLLRRVLAGGAVALVVFAAAAAVSNGRASQGPAGGAAVREAVADFPSMVAERQPERRDGGGAGPVSSLQVRASNEYGEYDEASLKLYGLEMVMEPFRDTTLEVVHPHSSELADNFVWRLRYADSSGTTAQSIDDAWSFTGGPKATVSVNKPGTLYILTVQNVDDDGVVVAEARVKASCKYVRREIRQLTDGDREAFFDAMQIFFTIPNAVGKTKYGEDFENYQKIVAYHDSRITDYCYHDGLQFLTSHIAFDLLMDRYLQMINPKVALPMWDMMIEAATMEDEWYNSVIFDKDWFGSALGSPENSFMVTEGRFGNISSIYDPTRSIAKGAIRANHNPYGYVTSVRNYQDLPRLTRTSSYCGLTSHATFATADTFSACYEESTLYNWEDCMETKVHGDLHGLLGGGFNCNTDMNTFSEQHPEYEPGLLSFVLEYMTFNYWPMNSFMPDYNTCDTRCESGQTEPCGCTCNVDAFALSDEETYSICHRFMAAASEKFTGDEFITHDAHATYPYGFLKDGERMSDEEAIFLMRYMVKIGCEPGSVGYMSTGASPMDPIFWVLHPMFEKALHILWLSPKYSETFDFEWVDGSCSGSGYTDKLPFTTELLGIGSGKSRLTNERLLELFHPSNAELPYVYEDFTSWGNTDVNLL